MVLSRSTFLNYGYFTNVESQDPQQYDLDPNYPGWPEFGPGWGSGITAWSGASTQASQPENAYAAALDYCQNYWFEGNPSPDETSQAAAAGVTVSTDPRSIAQRTEQRVQPQQHLYFHQVGDGRHVLWSDPDQRRVLHRRDHQLLWAGRGRNAL